MIPCNDAAPGIGRLPGTENLNEKAIPLSRLSATSGPSPPPGNDNLTERVQVAGPIGVTEKRITDDGFLKVLSQPSNDVE